MSTHTSAYPQDSIVVTADELVSQSIINLSNSIFSPIESSARNKLTKTMLQATLLSSISSIGDTLAQTISANSSSAELKKRAKLVVLRATIEWYGKLVSSASFVDFAQNFSSVLDSDKSLAEIQQMEDYDLFEVDHLPQLRRLVNDAKGIEKSLEVPEIGPFVPSFSIADLTTVLDDLDTAWKAKLYADNRILTGLIRKAFALDAVETSTGIDNTRMLTLIDVAVMLDRELRTETGIKYGWSVFGLEEHVAIEASAFVAMPFGTELKPLKGMKVIAKPSNGDMTKSFSYFELAEQGSTDGEEPSLMLAIKSLIEHALAPESARGYGLSLLTFPYEVHPLAPMLKAVFAKAFSARIPQVELNAYKLLQAFAEGSEVMNSKDVVMKFRAAVNRDVTAVNMALIDTFGTASSDPQALIDESVRKMYTYNHQLRDVFIGDNIFRLETAYDSVIKDGVVRWGVDNPVQSRVNHVLTVPLAFSEAVIRRNKLSLSRVVDSTSIETVRSLISDLYNLDDATTSNVTKEYSAQAIIQEVSADWPKNRTIPITRYDSGAIVTIADTLANVDKFSASDAARVVLYHTQQNGGQITLPATRSRLDISSVIHRMWGGSAFVCVYAGTRAQDNVRSYADVMAYVVNSVIQSYAKAPIATKVDSFDVLPPVANAPYRKRIVAMDKQFETFVITPEVKRLVSNPMIARALRDKLDVNLFSNPLYEYQINVAVLEQLRNYAMAVSKITKETYKLNSQAMEYLTKLITGTISAAELSSMQSIAYSSTITGLAEMLVGGIDKDNTILSLALLDMFTQAIIEDTQDENE